MKRRLTNVKNKIHEVHGDNIKLLSEELPKYKDKLKLYCNKCGHTFYAIYDNLVNKKSGCPYCSKRKKTNTEFICELISLFGKRLIYDKVHYLNAKTPVTLICPKHGEFMKTPNKLLSGQGCPKCKLSLLETITMNRLSSRNILFETQKHFDWLGRQSLDFYLPEYNIAIECQGEQHFHQVYFNGKIDNVDKRNLFESISKRDKNKFNLCSLHKIRLIYFIDKNIDMDFVKKISLYNDNFYFNIDNLINDILK